MILNFNFVHLPQYNNALNSRYHKVDIIPKTLCFGKGGLATFFSRFVHPSKPIREKYPNQTKMHNIENLVLIVEGKNKIRRNSGVSNVYMFLHADFEGFEFYAARKYVHLTKEGREVDFFVCDEDEEDDELLPVSESTVLV